MSAYRDAMRSYATFQGRTSQRDFLRAQWVFIPLVALAFGVFGLPVPGDGTAMGSRSVWPILGFLLIVLPHAVPWAALMVRRLHDMDHSGAWALLALVPFGFIVPFPLAGLVVWGTRPGTPWPNRFGPAPLGQDPQAAPSQATAASVTTFPPSSPAATPQRDVIAEIERLAQLRASGALSETEFEVMKAQALGQGGRA